MHHGIYVPLFGALADPHAAVDIACAAEEYGWDGLFVWDHVLSPMDGQWDIADPWVVLGAIAAATRAIRLGPMVTPLPRRRLVKLTRETVTVDRLSGGRLTLGLGTGGDIGREYSAFGEAVDARQRALILEEGVAVLTSLWAGKTVTHRGALIVDGVRAIPGPVQQPRIPIWFGTACTEGPPVERAARYDGIFPLVADPATVTRILDIVRRIRGTREGFDVAVAARPDTDLNALRRVGATWALHAFWPGHRPDQVLRVIRQGKPD